MSADPPNSRKRTAEAVGFRSSAAKKAKVAEHDPAADLGTRITASFMIANVIYPKDRSDFHGYFIGDCDCWIKDAPATSPAVRLTIHGKVFSTCRYYVYTATLKRRVMDDDSVNYTIIDIIDSKRSLLTNELVLYMFKEELRLNAFQRANLEEDITMLPKSTGDKLLAELKACNLYELFKDTDFFTTEEKFKVFCVFPEHPGRILRLKDEEIAKLAAAIALDPFEIIIRGEDLIGLGRAILERYIEQYFPNAPPALQSGLEMLEAMYRAQERTRSTLLPTEAVVRCYRPGVRTPTPDEFGTILKKLVDIGKVFLPPTVPNTLMFEYMREKEDAIIKMFQTVCENFQHHERISVMQQEARDLEIEGTTDEQMDAIRHILLNPITVISGIPGSGKTEILARYCSRFPRAFAVTFVGMQSVNLKTRVGNGCTLHSCIFRHHKLEKLPAKKRHKVYDELANQLSMAETIILDETSNIGLVELADTLIALVTKRIASKKTKAPVTRLVLTGDQNQIYPIAHGQVGVDIERAFASNACILKRNMRVNENARVLVDIDREFLAGDPKCFSEITANGGRFLVGNSTTRVTNFAAFPALLFDVNAAPLEQIVRYLIDSEKPYYDNNPIETLNHMVFLGFEKVDVARLAKCTKAFMADSYNVLLQVNRRFMVIDRLFRRKFVTKFNRKNIYSDEARNGQIFEVKDIRILQTQGLTISHIDKLYRGFNQKYDHVLVETKCGKLFCINNRFLNPNYIANGDVATVNKMQGGEADIVIAYLRPGISKNECWTHAELHVLISRARKQLILIADKADLLAIMSRYPPERSTRMPTLLRGFVDSMKFVHFIPLDDSVHEVADATAR